MQPVCLIVHDIRSAHNVGAILRTALCFGVEHVYIGGFSPYPLQPDDDRLPHIAMKVHQTIAKTALGAETAQSWSHYASLMSLFETLRAKDYHIAALELTKDATPLAQMAVDRPQALILGSEVNGVSSDLLSSVDEVVLIPQTTAKESLNVSVAAGIACYELTKSRFVDSIQP